MGWQQPVDQPAILPQQIGRNDVLISGDRIGRRLPTYGNVRLLILQERSRDTLGQGWSGRSQTCYHGIRNNEFAHDLFPPGGE